MSMSPPEACLGVRALHSGGGGAQGPRLPGEADSGSRRLPIVRWGLDSRPWLPCSGAALGKPLPRSSQLYPHALRAPHFRRRDWPSPRLAVPDVIHRWPWQIF